MSAAAPPPLSWKLWPSISEALLVMKPLAFVGSLVAGLWMIGSLAQAAEIGKPLADFELQDLDGRTHRLSDYQGKVVVIDFWSATCPVSTKYEPRLAKLYDTYTPRGVVFLGIDSNQNETREQIRQVAAERQVRFPILLDPQNRVADLYQAKTTPHTYLVDPQGILRYEGAIDNDSWASAPGASLKPILALALDAVLGGKPVPVEKMEPWGCSIKRMKR